MGPHDNAVRKPFVSMNSYNLRAPDLYADAIGRLEKCKDSSIAIPELSSLLRVKSTTLNAKLRRQRIAVQTIGRTNFVPGVLALKLAELHKHALIGWPTLQQASAMSGVKAGTIKARCEKGQLESYLDLTKRLRINPTALDRLQVRAPTDKPLSSEKPFQEPLPQPLVPTERDGPPQRTRTVRPRQANAREALRREDLRSSRKADVAAKGRPNADVTPAVSPLRAISSNEPRFEADVEPPRVVPARPEIVIISRRDYGLPEIEAPTHPQTGPAKVLQKPSKSPGFLTYDPDRPFPISACAVGKWVRYDEYDGKIVAILDDPFSPKIKVLFAEHRHPLMREVLLTVGKRKTAEPAR